MLFRNILSFLLIITFSCLKAQSISYPEIKTATGQVIIKEISVTDFHTRIDFIYKSNEDIGRYIFLSPQGSENAYYIQIGSKRYNLLFTVGIGNKDGETLVMPYDNIEFYALFEKIPSNTDTFNLIEGKNGSWNFYGVKFKQSPKLADIPCNSPTHKTLCFFKVQKCYYNGKDLSNQMVDNEQYITVYQEYGITYLSNVASKSNTQSYGKIILSDSEKMLDYQSFYFNWDFKNSYNNLTGIASVKIVFQQLKAYITIKWQDNIIEYITSYDGDLKQLIYPKKKNIPVNRSKQTSILRKDKNFKLP